MADRPNDPADEPEDDAVAEPGEPMDRALDVDAEVDGDDALAARIRAAVDGSAAPVALDEVVALAGAGADVVELRSTGTEAAADGPVDGPTDLEPSAPVARSSRRRLPLVLAAAAVAVVLIGLGFAVVRNRSESVVAGPGETSTGAVAPGGIYDPAADVLRDKRVEAMAPGGGRLYLGYVDGLVARAADLEAEAEELNHQADAVGEEIATIEAEIAADPDAPENELRREEIAGLRDRQTDLNLQANDAQLESRLQGEDEQPDPVASRYGVLVVDADDGAVLADHPLEGRPSEWAMAADGDRVWFATDVQAWGEGGPPPTNVIGEGVAPSTAVSGIWVAAGTDAPRLVDTYQGGVSLALTDDALWVRSYQRLDRRDPSTGDLVGSAAPGAWTSDGVVAADGDVVWATDDEHVMPVVGTSPGEPVAVEKHDFGERRLFVVGDAVLVVDGRTAARVVGGRVTDFHSFSEVNGLIGADAGTGRFWLAGLDDDPESSLIGVLTIEGSTGAMKGSQESIVGDRPMIAALADGDAVVCVEAVRTSDDEVPTRAGFGSDCRRIVAPTDSIEPTTDALAPSGSVATTEAEAVDDPEQETTTTRATGPTMTVLPTTSTRPVTRSLSPTGLTWDGLDPIRLGMTADELTAATGLATAPGESGCGESSGRQVVGLPEGVFVLFGGDDRVGAVVVDSPTFSTADGLRVGSSVADLLARHPDAEAEDLFTAVQYRVIAPDRSRGIYLSAEGDHITRIIATFGDQPFSDLC